MNFITKLFNSYIPHANNESVDLIISISEQKIIPLILKFFMRNNVQINYLMFALQVSEDGNITTSIVSFTPSVEDYGKTLTCRVESHNPSDSDRVYEDSWKLNVHRKYALTT